MCQQISKSVDNVVQYHDGSFLLSFNKLLIFDVGGRSIGKSFFWKTYAMNRYLKTGRKFLYVRRYKNDIDLIMGGGKYFEDIGIKFPNHDLKCENGDIGTFYCDGELCGYALGLSSASKIKSLPLTDIDLIVFDEFIAEDGKYLGGKNDPFKEPRLCESLIVSIARGGGRVVREEVRMVFIGNTHDRYNPYFQYHGISEKFQEDTKIIRGPFWVVSKDNAPSVTEAIQKTQIGAMLSHSSYGNMALGGNWENEDNTFVGKITAPMKYFATLKSSGQFFGVYECEELGVYYISNKVDMSDPYKYTLSIEDHEPNFVTARQNSRAWKMVLLKDAWGQGFLRFETQLAKRIWLKFVSSKY